MGEACCTHGREEKFVGNFVWKFLREESAEKI